MKTPLRWSKTFLLHYWKLVFRSMLFLAAGITYVYNRIHHTGELFGGFERNSLLLSVIWIIFAVEMVLRFFLPVSKVWVAKSSLPKTIDPPVGKRCACSPGNALLLYFWPGSR